MDLTKLFKLVCIAAALTIRPAFALTGATSGQLVLINGLGNVTASTGNAGATASSIKVQVSDHTGPCSAATTIAYNGTLVIKWATTATHSSTSCTDIESVAVTPLKSTIGSVSTIIYDSVNTTPLPATVATAAITYVAPTTAYNNIALIISGRGAPATATTANATTWGIGGAGASACAVPIFDENNGALTTVGVPGGAGTYGIKAEQIMRRYAIIPYH